MADIKNYLTIKGYTQYTKEELGELFKAYFIYNEDINNNDFTFKQYAIRNFFLPITEMKLDYQINQKFPIINYNNKIVKYLLKNKIITLNNIYNKPQNIKDVSDKTKFHKIMEDSKFIPKTVYKKTEAENLKFPIIAKPANSHSGIGIKIFKKLNDLNECTEKFNVFSEYKNIEEEYRIIFFKEEPILYMIKEPLNIKAKGGEASLKESMIFSYTKLNAEYLPDEFKPLFKEIRNKFKNIDIFALDIMKDDKGNFFIIEINSQPGLPFDSSVKLYKHVYKDFYKKQLSDVELYRLNILSSDLNTMTVQDNKFLIR